MAEQPGRKSSVAKFMPLTSIPIQILPLAPTDIRHSGFISGHPMRKVGNIPEPLSVQTPLNEISINENRRRVKELEWYLNKAQALIMSFASCD